MPFFDSHSSENTSLYVGNKIALLSVLHHKKKRVCFFVAKTRWTQLYSTKNMFGLFAVILGCFQSYCTNQLYSKNTIFWFVRRKMVLLTALLHREKVFF